MGVNCPTVKEYSSTHHVVTRRERTHPEVACWNPGPLLHEFGQGSHVIWSVFFSERDKGEEGFDDLRINFYL